MGFSLKKVFGGGSGGGVPAYNTGPLKDILNQGAEKQRGLTNNLNLELSPVTGKFGDTQTKNANDFVTGQKTLGEDYVRSLNNPTLRDEAVGRINENAFRNVPAAQQAIKESLAGTGRMGNGRATNLLAQPVLQAAQQAGDQATEYDVNQDQTRQNALGQVFGNNASALSSKLGLDSDTARTLMENGRGDLITKAANLMGVEGDLSQGLFNLEDTKQKSDIAAAEAANQRRNALYNSLLGIGGQLGAAYLTKGASTVKPPVTAQA